MNGWDRLIGCLLWRLFCVVLLRILCESSENCLEVRLLGHVVYRNCDKFLVVVSMYPIAGVVFRRRGMEGRLYVDRHRESCAKAAISIMHPRKFEG